MSRPASPLRLVPLDTAHQELVSSALPLVPSIAAKLFLRRPGTFTMDEFIAIGRKGAVTAAQMFNPSEHVAFTTYAYIRIEGAMEDAVRRERKHRFHFIAAGAHVEASNFLAERRDQPGDDGRDTKADWERRSSDFGGELAAAVVARMGTSVVLADDGGPEAMARRPMVARLMALLKEAAHTLNPREQQVLELHHLQDLDLREVAAKMGIGYSSAKRFNGSLTKKLRAFFEEKGVPSLRATGAFE